MGPVCSFWSALNLPLILECGILHELTNITIVKHSRVCVGERINYKVQISCWRAPSFVHLQFHVEHFFLMIHAYTQEITSHFSGDPRVYNFVIASIVWLCIAVGLKSTSLPWIEFRALKLEPFDTGKKFNNNIEKLGSARRYVNQPPCSTNQQSIPFHIIQISSRAELVTFLSSDLQNLWEMTNFELRW